MPHFLPSYAAVPSLNMTSPLQLVAVLTFQSPSNMVCESPFPCFHSLVWAQGGRSQMGQRGGAVPAWSGRVLARASRLPSSPLVMSQRHELAEESSCPGWLERASWLAVFFSYLWGEVRLPGMVCFETAGRVTLAFGSKHNSALASDHFFLPSHLILPPSHHPPPRIPGQPTTARH